VIDDDMTGGSELASPAAQFLIRRLAVCFTFPARVAYLNVRSATVTFGPEALRTERIFHRPLVFLPECSALLVSIWMTVTPIPVLVLVFVVLFGICTIGLVLFGQVSAVRVVLTIIPIMIVLVVPIVDSDLNAGLLGCGSSHS